MLEIKDLFIDIESNNGTVNAVIGVSLNVKRKELLAIVGESGCGKFILCRSIIKLLPKGANIKSGEIIVNGKHVENMSEKEAYNFRGKDVGVIFQNSMTSLNPTITIGNQIAEALLVHKNISKKEAIEEAITLMELVGIDYPR
ncbi:ATP-binding cassette domain-containing protein [Clostridium thermobutyricum]|uniref:Oligopeptide transport ATP-binding protein OppD n=1 Tax=Clostridium thermobutyricum DSM 4928 TaxID=1121339 RepID=A0A1V4SYV5_9CLOT|nr:ATP-binding cassette domain-containing protein [Clostridium thermobutyricum]OPX50426.1 oligopeptide transport ATP-binding protein OppD [Clostridium thermobutyricum DSM 4928]